METGLCMMADGGEALFIVPHGVLFRGQAEASIRESILRDHLLKTLAGVPANLFLNTQIPVCVMRFGQSDGSVMIVDGSKHFEKRSKQNFFRDEDIAAILGGTDAETPYLSHLAGMAEIEQNQYNLNIPRYVCTDKPEELPPLAETLKGLYDAKVKAAECEKTLFEMMKQLTGLTAEEMELIRKCFA